MRQDSLSLAIAVIALPLVGLHVAYKQQPSSTEIEHLSGQFRARADWVGKVAPDFELELLNGEKFRLSDHVGRELVVLNFFATWCGPCRAEMPEFNRLALENRGKPFLVLGIDAEEKHDLVAAFVKDLKLAFPVAIDASGDVMKGLGVDSYPTTIFIGGDGRIQLYQNGVISNSEVAFAEFLGTGLKQLSEHQGIAKEDYLAAVARETYPTKGGTHTAGPSLAGRAKVLASRMDCPCGCEHKVEGCGCNTAKKIKVRLAKDALDGKTDEQITKEMDREFCMKGMD